MAGMIAPLHEQLRAAREAHGYSQHKLAALAGLARVDIQRIEKGDNVTIRKIEAYIGALPHLQSLHIGGVEIKGRFTVDVESVRQMVLDIVTTSANVLQVLGQAESQERDGAPKQPLPGAGGATRHRPNPGVSPELRDYLRQIDPTYKAARAARGSAAQPASPTAPDAKFPPADES
jgi:transcriptional regulator with XRE-family HTH domain